MIERTPSVQPQVAAVKKAHSSLNSHKHKEAKLIVKSWLVLTLLSLSYTGTNRDAPTPREVSLETADGISISATYWLPTAVESNVPGVILIHQGGSTRAEWQNMPKLLTQQGYAVIAYDVRGHGKSNKVPSISALFNDPEQAPQDLIRVIEFLKEQPQIDGNRLAVVGSSIGGNLACVAVSSMEVKTAVAMACKTSAARNLNGTRSFQPRSVLYIASEGDGGGNRAKWARELFDLTGPPRKLIIAAGALHGVGMFRDNPQLEQDILTWLGETL